MQGRLLNAHLLALPLASSASGHAGVARQFVKMPLPLDGLPRSRATRTACAAELLLWFQPRRWRLRDFIDGYFGMGSSSRPSLVKFKRHRQGYQ